MSDVIYLEDLQGRLLGTRVLRPGEDARKVAIQLLNRKSCDVSGFYAPIPYPIRKY